MALKKVQEAVRKPVLSTRVRGVTTAREASTSGSKKSVSQTHDADMSQVCVKAVIITCQS